MTLAPSPLVGEGGEGGSREGKFSRLRSASPPPPLTPPHRKSGLPDLRIIDAKPGQARVSWGGEQSVLAAHTHNFSFFFRCPSVRSRSALRRMKPSASRWS